MSGVVQVGLTRVSCCCSLDSVKFVRVCAFRGEDDELSRNFRVRWLSLAAAALASLMAVGVPAAAYAEEGLGDETVQTDSQSAEAQDQAPAENESALDEGESLLESGVDSSQTLSSEDVSVQVAPAGRTISGTINFDERTTLAQKQDVSVGATQIFGEDVAGVPVDSANISYDPASGDFSIVNLEAGKYKLGVRMDTDSGWWFTPGLERTVGWDASDTSTGGSFEALEVDVTEDNRVDMQLYFDAAHGGVSFTVFYGGVLTNAIATDTDTGERAELLAVSGGAGEEMQGTTFNRVLATGTKITLHAEVNGTNVYYDGTPNGTLDPTQALEVTVGLWQGDSYRMDARELSPAIPNVNLLTDQNRGDFDAPASASMGSKIHVYVGTNYAGKTVWGWLFSDPSALGSRVVDERGYVNFTLPAGVTGDHRLVVTYATGSPVGWGNISISGPGSGSSIELAQTGASFSPIFAAALAGMLLLGGAVSVGSAVRAKKNLV